MPPRSARTATSLCPTWIRSRTALPSGPPRARCTHHGGLLAGFAAAGQASEAGQRLLVRAADGLEPVLAQALAAWQGDGSVVLVHPDVPVTERLLSDERVSRS